MKNLLLLLAAASNLFPVPPSHAETVVVGSPEMAGISGFRAFWNLPVVVQQGGVTQMVNRSGNGQALSAFWSLNMRNGGALPGAPVFDAVHRSLLVKFPTAGDQLGQLVNQGKRIEKLELILPLNAVELWPELYADPAGMSFLGTQWANNPPRWHAVAWPLRRTWTSDAQAGPTFNAAVNGLDYWAAYGATNDQEDRFPVRMGPAEVSAANPQGRMDITAFVTDPSLGDTLTERLRVLSHQGLVIRKLEVYDAALWNGGYEWTTGTGGRGIIVQAPRLEATMVDASGQTETVDLSALRWDAASAIAQMTASGGRGTPTAVLPTQAEFASLAAEYGPSQPDWMPAWQWQRVQQLSTLGGGTDFPQTYTAYEQWLDNMLKLPPRRWDGFQGPKYAQLFFQYNKALPAPVKDHWKLYWWAWLMPDRTNSELVHGYIGGAAAQAYYQSTKDWRGNFSVYRTYVRSMGTVNFNSWATAGTLLGGAILEDEFLIQEGRAGLSDYMLRTWSWFDGSHQESIDHYYLAHTLQANKVYTDFGPKEMDRMIGSMIQSKNVGELVGAFHPNLRRFISASSRTGLDYLFATQDGLSHILHTLSPKGALTDANRATTVGGMRTIGADVPPRLVAEQTSPSPWAPEWISEMVDEKPLPFTYTNSYKKWGTYNATPLWKKGYLGQYFGLASQDVTENETVPVMAQWVRKPEAATSAEDIGTLLVRYGLNTTEFLDTVFHGTTSRNPNGIVGVQGGLTNAVQHNNKVMVLGSPLDQLAFSGGRPVPNQVFSLQTSIALMNFQSVRTWEIYVSNANGFRLVNESELPLTLSFQDRIVIKDGATYIGVVPLPATDLGRNAEVILTNEGQLTALQGSGQAKPALTINAYNFRSPVALDKSNADWAAIRAAFSGFVIEMADQVQYPNFQDFLNHIKQASLNVTWNAGTQTADLGYVSGSDVFDVAFKPDYSPGVRTDAIFPRRLVNGVWPYLGSKMDRDSTYSQQGRTGRLEKNGSVLISQPDRMAYLETVPSKGVTAAYNPFPEPMNMRVETPGGVTISSNGNMGLTRIVYDEQRNHLSVEYPSQTQGGEGMAEFLSIAGAPSKPTLSFNGETSGVLDNGALGWKVKLLQERLPGENPDDTSAPVTWQTATNISGDSDVVTTGQLINAWNFGTTSDTTVNGVTFTGWNPSGTGEWSPSGPNTSLTNSNTILSQRDGYGRPANSAFWLSVNSSSGSAPFSGLSPEYQALLGRSSYADGLSSPNKSRLTFTNLTVGTEYLFQAWINDSRGGLGGSISQVFTNGASLNGNRNSGTNPAAGGMGQFVTATFTANSTSQSFEWTGDGFIYMTAVQLRLVGGQSTPTSPPTVPSVLSARSVSASQINLAWSDNSSNEAGFKIERKTGSSGAWSQIATVGAGVKTYSNTGLSVSTEYFYRVRAGNSAGDSTYSNEAGATTHGLPSPPAPPSGLTATATSASQINLAWSDNANNETGFKIERKTGSGGTWIQIGTVVADVTTFSSTGLSASTTYFYRVRSFNGLGDSAFSSEANATTPSGPAAPSALSVTSVSASQISLAWSDNSSDETSFKIERKTGSGGSWIQIGTVGAGVTTYSNTGLSASTNYFYRVRATNSVGDSAYSNETNASTQTAGDVPAPPSGLSATPVSDIQINLAWSDNSSNETGFKIERITGGSWSQIATVGAGVTSFTNTGLSASTTYFYRVRATNSAGDSAYSNDASATTQSAQPSTGIVWQTASNISGDTDVVTTGELFQAWNFGTSSNTTVNGVTFTGWNPTGNSSSITNGKTVLSQLDSAGNSISAGSWESFNSGSFAAPFGNLSAGYKALLFNSSQAVGLLGTVVNPSNKVRTTFTNLMIGADYLFQVWFNDSRAGTRGAINQVFTNGASLRGNMNPGSIPAAGGVGQHVTGTFTASSTSQSFEWTGNGFIYITAAQLRSLPPVSSTTRGTSISWLAQRFGSVSDYNALEEIDHDGDGQSAWMEYRAGTDPLNGSDAFRILEMTLQPDGSTLLRWRGSVDHGISTPFRVLASETLQPGSWVLRAASVPRDPSGITTWIDTTPLPSGGRIFYRIKAPLAPE